MLSAVVAALSAVLLPQIVHSAGAALGVGSLAGEVLLPMHLPVLLVGLLAGPVAGLSAGALSPLLSALLTGMPTQAILPFMCVELSVYGIVSGLLKNRSLPTAAKVLIAQLAGRAVRAAAILTASLFGVSLLPASIIWTSIRIGLPGIVLQLILIPLIMRAVARADRNE